MFLPTHETLDTFKIVMDTFRMLSIFTDQAVLRTIIMNTMQATPEVLGQG